jgi:hypothetical protein
VRFALSDAICRNHTLRLGSATAAVRSEVRHRKVNTIHPSKPCQKAY